MWGFEFKIGRTGRGADGTMPDVRHRRQPTVDVHPSGRRKYAAAQVNNMTASMDSMQTPADADIQRAINRLRARSRSEMQNNGYAKRVGRIYQYNIVGPQGMRLQPKPLLENGKIDKFAASAILASWQKWGKLLNGPDVTSMLSWRMILNQFWRSLFVDGEAILVRYDDWPDNDFGFAVRFVDPVQLDADLNRELPNGRVIRMGVELDEFGRRTAFYFTKFKRTDEGYRQTPMHSHDRIEADRVLHVFDPEFTFQTRGVPHLAASLMQFHHLRGYEFAELIGSRVANSRPGWFIESEDGGEYTGDTQDEPDDGEDEGERILEMGEPGVFGTLPFGTKVEVPDMNHPTSQYDAFMKRASMGALAGVGAMYNQVTGDLEGVNFSSLRQGNLWAQDVWLDGQAMMHETICDWTYAGWLSKALLTDLHLDFGQQEKYMQLIWRGRRWKHVQPHQQAQADTQRLANRTETFSQQILEAGDDPDETFQQWQQDIEQLEALGIPLPTVLTGQTNVELEPEQDEPVAPTTTA